MEDLCSTTTRSLAKGLVDLGHDVMLMNPDKEHIHETFPWSHHSLNQSTKRGFQASSVSKSALAWFKQNPTNSIDVILVDWQLARLLMPALKKMNCPLILMDRSPPADASLFGKLQWREWKRAWKFVQNREISSGCVVSKAHREFVQEKYSIPSETIHVLPAGADTDLFRPQEKPSINEEIGLVYHGRLDKHRGILSLPMFAQKLQSAGINARLTLIGEGDVYENLKQTSTQKPWLRVLPRMHQHDLADLLAKQHIGFLPMPESKVWSIASPLKRSEYLSSGLLVLGLRHKGHIIEKGNPDWFHLLPQHDFHDLGIKWVKSLDADKFNERSKQARAYASNHCGWKTSIGELNEAIHRALKEV